MAGLDAEAEQVVATIFARDRHSAGIRNAVIRHFSRSGDHSLATAAFRAWHEMDPQDWRIAIRYAEALAAAGRDDAAAAMISTLFEENARTSQTRRGMLDKVLESGLPALVEPAVATFAAMDHKGMASYLHTGNAFGHWRVLGEALRRAAPDIDAVDLELMLVEKLELEGRWQDADLLYR